ncbi:hypothetical protein [Micromonospora sp. URMC 106]
MLRMASGQVAVGQRLALEAHPVDARPMTPPRILAATHEGLR